MLIYKRNNGSINPSIKHLDIEHFKNFQISYEWLICTRNFTCDSRAAI